MNTNIDYICTVNVFKSVFMKTNQLMVRDFLGSDIKQSISNKYLSATDLMNIYNNGDRKKSLSDFWKLGSTKDFLQALKNELNANREDSPYLETDLFITKRGNKGETFMHPYLFIEFAAWLNAEFRVKMYKWIYDNLIDFRHQAGDYYKEMCEVMQEKYIECYDKKPDPLLFIKEANYLNQLVFGVNSGKRNEATEEQLDLMNRLQKANIKMIKDGMSKIERHKLLRSLAIFY